MRRALALVAILMAGSASADSPAIPRWQAPSPANCADFDHPDKVVVAMNAAPTCHAAMAVYFRCEARWDNNPEMESAALTRCEDHFQPKISAARYERYEALREACIERYQAKDMRILWSAVRACRVRLALDWANRYGKR